MKNLFILIFILIGFENEVIAQEKSYEEIKGDKFSFCYSFNRAIDAYKHAKHLSLNGQRGLADAYHKIGQNIEAEKVYSKIVNLPDGILPDDYYNYAMVLKTNGNYNEVDKWMDKFIALKPDDLRAKDYIANKDKLVNLLSDLGKLKIEYLDINTDALDFGASYYKNKVVFASTRRTPGLSSRKYNWTQKPFWNMFECELVGDQLVNPKIFDNEMNGKMNDGPASFSKDGTYMAFTRNNYQDRSKDRVIELQIYFSSYKDGKWSKPESFAYNNKAYSVGHPCLSSDGNSMFFTSDMPGGYGKTDIYKISKDENGKWKKPENLGNTINTEGDEMFPFFEENKEILFFTSNGHFGLGGLDIFSCRINKSGNGQVFNAGYPMNTKYDDFAFIVNDDMKKGFFSSDRIGGSGGDDIYSFEMMDPEVKFSVIVPVIKPLVTRIRETFPLRNYIFFDLGSTNIVNRYILLTKDQVKSFKEDKLEESLPIQSSGRSKRQLTVYYNIINILGDRMGRNPGASITLVGSSEKGPKDGRAMAMSVKKYLVDIFGIKVDRINLEGNFKPRIPSEQPGGILELALLREGDRRVSVESNSPAILKEFISGPEAILKPIPTKVEIDKPIDNNVYFSVNGASNTFSSWSLEIIDQNEEPKRFGPYTNDMVMIPVTDLLGLRAQGDFNARMVGQTKFGTLIKKEEPFHVERLVPNNQVELTRFSVIFEFDDSKSILIYIKYLTEIIIPNIPTGATILIHGHTDIIGNEDNNLKLSEARANDVKVIFENGLTKIGRSDVKFEVHGFGEDQNEAPFENRYPEERFYNRTVIIDIIPMK